MICTMRFYCLAHVILTCGVSFPRLGDLANMRGWSFHFRYPLSKDEGNGWYWQMFCHYVDITLPKRFLLSLKHCIWLVVLLAFSACNFPLTKSLLTSRGVEFPQFHVEQRSMPMKRQDIEIFFTNLNFSLLAPGSHLQSKTPLPSWMNVHRTGKLLPLLLSHFVPFFVLWWAEIVASTKDMFMS